MHELGITRNLVAIVSEAAKGRRVTKVWLEIGERTALMPDALRFCFDVVAKGTPLEASELHIVELAAGWQCGACGQQYRESEPSRCSACGGTQFVRRSGEELNVKSMEVQACA